MPYLIVTVEAWDGGLFDLFFRRIGEEEEQRRQIIEAVLADGMQVRSIVRGSDYVGPNERAL